MNRRNGRTVGLAALSRDCQSAATQDFLVQKPENRAILPEIDVFSESITFSEGDEL